MLVFLIVFSVVLVLVLGGIVSMLVVSLNGIC